MLNEAALKLYIKKKFPDIERVVITKLGSGVQGAGFLVEMVSGKETRSYVVKALISEGFGHDYPSDRAAVFLLDLDEYSNLPQHVRAVDVLAEMADGSIRSIGGGVEYYLMMERGHGTDYFADLHRLSGKDRLEDRDVKKIVSMASYLASVHSVRKDSKTLYWRKLRDTVGHGECLMGVFDIYPDGTLPYGEMADIIKQSVDWVYRLRPGYKRLSQIHGDFHPGNIWFSGDSDFVLLDRSRGPWGEPADDITALAINYIFFSVRVHGDVRGACLEGLNLFFEEYIRLSGDEDLPEVVAPFFAFRAAVVANPVFYPDLTREKRDLIFRFCRSVLKQDRFDPSAVNSYL